MYWVAWLCVSPLSRNCKANQNPVSFLFPGCAFDSAFVSQYSPASSGGVVGVGASLINRSLGWVIFLIKSSSQPGASCIFCSGVCPCNQVYPLPVQIYPADLKSIPGANFPALLGTGKSGKENRTCDPPLGVCWQGPYSK